MGRAILIGFFVLFPLSVFAADPKPTAAEEEDIRGLVAKLVAFETEKKVAAIEELGKYGPKAKAAVPKLCEMTSSLYEAVQLAAIEALVDIGDTAAMPALKKVIRDSRYDAARAKAKGAVDAFAAADVIAAVRTTNRPSVDDLRKLAAASGGVGTVVRRTAGDKLTALLEKYGGELFPALLAKADDDTGVELVLAAAKHTGGEAVYAAALPLVGKGEKQTALATALITEKAKADPKGFATLLDATLAKPDAGHARTVFEVALATDDGTFAFRLRMLKSGVAEARRMAARACAGEQRLTAEVRVACRDLIGDADADTSAAAVAVFKLSVEQKLVPIKDCLAMLRQGKEKQLLALAVLERVGGVGELPAVVAVAVDADREVKAAAAACAGSVISALKADAKLPAEAIRKLIRELTTHPSADVRAAAVAFHTRKDVINTIPADDWVRWSKDADPRVRMAAVPGLDTHAKADRAAKERLTALDADPDPAVRSAARMAAAGIDPLLRPVDWLLTPDTGLVLHVQLSTFFGLPVVKKHLLADLRKTIKDRPALKAFKFDPIDDLESATLIVEGETGVGVIRGRFAKEQKLKAIQLDEDFARGAVCMSDSLILTAESKDAVEKLALRKPADPEKTKSLRAVMPPAETYLGWVVFSPQWLTANVVGPLKAWANVDPTDDELKAIGGVRLGVRIKNGVWAVEVRVDADGEGAALAWKGHLAKVAEVLAAFLPLIAGNVGAELAGPCRDLADALTKVAIDTDKTGVTATIKLKTETVEAVVKVLAEQLKKE